MSRTTEDDLPDEDSTGDVGRQVVAPHLELEDQLWIQSDQSDAHVASFGHGRTLLLTGLGLEVIVAH